MFNQFETSPGSTNGELELASELSITHMNLSSHAEIQSKIYYTLPIIEKLPKMMTKLIPQDEPPYVYPPKKETPESKKLKLAMNNLWSAESLKKRWPMLENVPLYFTIERCTS